MSEKKIDIYNKYSHEINKINNLLSELEKARVYENDKVPGIPSCSTLASQLREAIKDLLDKINNNKDGFSEYAAKKISEIFNSNAKENT